MNRKDNVHTEVRWLNDGPIRTILYLKKHANVYRVNLLYQERKLGLVNGDLNGVTRHRLDHALSQCDIDEVHGGKEEGWIERRLRDDGWGWVGRQRGVSDVDNGAVEEEGAALGKGCTLQ